MVPLTTSSPVPVTILRDSIWADGTETGPDEYPRSRTAPVVLTTLKWVTGSRVYVDKKIAWKQGSIDHQFSVPTLASFFYLWKKYLNGFLLDVVEYNVFKAAFG